LATGFEQARLDLIARRRQRDIYRLATQQSNAVAAGAKRRDLDFDDGV
jgi:hypothetical protein